MALHWGRVVKVSLPGTGLAPIDSPRIDFDIQGQADAEQNWAEIKIFNLSESTYAVIKKRSEQIVVDAGYESLGGPARIFEGTIERVDKQRQENAFVTLIVASDKLHSVTVRGGHISESFDGPTSARAIAVKIVDAMKDVERSPAVSLGRLDAIPASATVTDFRADGQPAKELTRLLSLIPGDVVWYVDMQGVVRMDNGPASRTDAPSIVKSPSTGLIATPSVEEEGRMSCSILLDPRVELGSRFVIEDSQYIDASPYKVVGIEHSGTNFRGQFRTTLDCLSLDYKREP